MATLKEIAKQIRANTERIILIYAFNSTGKTKFSVEYKNITKKKGGKHAGVYYNAYSEDLFRWDNDEPNNNESIKLEILDSSLNQFIKKIDNEEPIREKLIPYNPKYNFKLVPVKADNLELGWASVVFFLDEDPETQIKISRGEERIFVWCFFLALFEIEGWADEQNEHILIDDPVSSLDDNNVFITARLILELFEKHSDSRRIILTTHHMGLFSILYDWLSKGENSSKFKVRRRVERQRADGKIEVKEVEENKYMVRFLERDGDSFHLRGRKKGTVLYHLLLLQIINDADLKDELHTYHFVLLRQVLESIASFLGEGRFSYVLDKLSFEDANVKSDIINALSHEKVYSQKLSPMGGDTKVLFRKVFKTLKDTFYFSI